MSNSLGAAVGASVGGAVGASVGVGVGAAVAVGGVVGASVGEAVGAFVGLDVAKHRDASPLPITKPSRHSHRQRVGAICTALVLLVSHAWEPSPQGWYVGMCVGDVVGTSVTVGSGVGAPVGLNVAKHCDASLLSDTKPSRHSHRQTPPIPPGTALVLLVSHPWEPSSQGW